MLVRVDLSLLEGNDRDRAEDNVGRSHQCGLLVSRLLNLVDGLIGQGMKVNVLITTNEPLGGFHPAVSRPGRCGAVISFELFGAAEGAGWLAGQGSDASAPGAATLAELFAIRDGRRPAELRRPIGFAHSRQPPTGDRNGS